MRTISSMLALAVSSLALGGCQALFGPSSFAERAPMADPSSLDMADYFAARLEAGREHLAAKRPTQAVNAFRQASYDPAFAGRAYNGMGVAYAQLGREDLALRYFTMAVAADPSEERFARNLARLEGADVTTDADRVELASAAQPAAQAPSPESRSSEVQPSQNSAVVRVSPREVQIQSATGSRSDKTISSDPQDSPLPGRSVAFSRPAPASGYPVRVELPRAGAGASSAYPVRIALSDAGAQQRTGYPIRIELSESE